MEIPTDVAKKRKGWLREEPETLQQKIEEDEELDESVPEVNGGDYNEDGREEENYIWLRSWSL